MGVGRVEVGMVVVVRPEACRVAVIVVAVVRWVEARRVACQVVGTPGAARVWVVAETEKGARAAVVDALVVRDIQARVEAAEAEEPPVKAEVVTAVVAAARAGAKRAVQTAVETLVVAKPVAALGEMMEAPRVVEKAAGTQEAQKVAKMVEGQ